MSIFSLIALSILLVVIFWCLHLYSVRRAKYLVRQELESHFEYLGDKQRIESAETYQYKDTKEALLDPQSAISPDSIKPNKNVRIEPSITHDQGRWATSN